MKSLIAVAVGLMCLGSLPGAAANLCNCCGDKTVPACATACAAIKPPQGQCVATVDFAAKADISAGNNPLYDVPLRNMWLGTPDKNGLEVFRRLLERARRGAETDRKAALRAEARGKIDATAAAAMAKRYDEAIINYYLGIQAFRLARDRMN